MNDISKGDDKFPKCIIYCASSMYCRQASALSHIEILQTTAED